MPTSIYIEYWSCFKPIYKNDKGELFQMSIRPFTIAVPQSIPNDVRERLAHTPVLSEVEGSGNLSA